MNCNQFAPRLAAAGALALSAGASAQVVVDTSWVGPAQLSKWEVPAFWSANTIPNNTPAERYRVSVRTAGGAALVSQTAPATVDALAVGPEAFVRVGQLAVLQNMRIDGIVELSGPLRLGSAATLDGDGTIRFRGGAFFGGQVSCDGGPLVIGAGIQFNDPSVPSGVGTVGDPLQPTINNGHVFGSEANFFRPMIVTGNGITNNGTFELRGSNALGFGGTFTRAGLGTLVQSPNGRFIVEGTLNNAGQTFHVTPSERWVLSGTIQGGSITIADGAPLEMPYGVFAGTLNNATFTGHIAMGQAVTLNVPNGLLAGNGIVSMAPPPLEGPSRIVNPTFNGSLTIGAGVTVRGGGNDFLGGFNGSGVGSDLQVTTNLGTIRSDAHGVLSVRGTEIKNAGTLAVQQDCVLSVLGDLELEAGSRVAVELGDTSDAGFLYVDGDLDFIGPGEILDLSIGAAPVTLPRQIVRVTGTMFDNGFDVVTPGFTLMYVRTPTGSLTRGVYVTSIPEPAAIAVTAMVGALTLRRPRRRQQGGRHA